MNDNENWDVIVSMVKDAIQIYILNLFHFSFNISLTDVLKEYCHARMLYARKIKLYRS